MGALKGNYYLSSTGDLSMWGPLADSVDVDVYALAMRSTWSVDQQRRGGLRAGPEHKISGTAPDLLTQSF